MSGYGVKLDRFGSTHPLLWRRGEVKSRIWSPWARGLAGGVRPIPVLDVRARAGSPSDSRPTHHDRISLRGPCFTCPSIGITSARDGFTSVHLVVISIANR